MNQFNIPDPRREEKLKAFDRMLTIMDELRINCPWDKKQTLESLRHLTIEEVFELSDAIIDGNLEEIQKELGDIILHIAFYSKIGSEKGAFDMADVLNGICEKLIHRHPHIYGDIDSKHGQLEAASDEDAVKRNWEQIKLKEKGNSHWLIGNAESDNVTGFSARPGGYRFADGTFHTKGSNGYWWLHHSSYEMYGFTPRLYKLFADISRDEHFKNYGFSVRCIKD